VYPQEGTTINPSTLPTSYEAFVIRSRFPIFTDATSGKVQRTAHVMMSNACPYHRNSAPSRTISWAGASAATRSPAAADGCEYVRYEPSLGL
jgi:hypothetical protein